MPSLSRHNRRYAQLSPAQGGDDWFGCASAHERCWMPRWSAPQLQVGADIAVVTHACVASARSRKLHAAVKTLF